MMITPIVFDEGQIAQFCRKHHIRRLSLFGSALRGELRADSDVDFLVEFDPQYTPTYFALAGMEDELGTIVGRKADLRTVAELSRYFRDRVLREAKPIYAAA